MKKIVTKLAVLCVLAVSPAMAADIDGEWNLMLSAAEGSTYVSMTIAVDGEAATGKSGDETLTGTYIDGELKLTGDLYIADAGYASKADMTAKMDGERLSGFMSWEGYALDISGSRK